MTSSSDHDPPPSVALTGAFQAGEPPRGDTTDAGSPRADDADDPAPAGPPSVGLLNTGAFPAPPPASEAPTHPLLERVSTPDAFEPTVFVPPPAPDRAHASTIDLTPSRPATPSAPSAHRPLEPMTPPPPAEDEDPAVLATRPPSAPVAGSSGGGWAWLLVALVCLAGTVYLVRHAFPELFGRATLAVAADEARPGTLLVKVTPAPDEVAWRLLEGAEERGRGVAAPDAKGAFELRPEGLPEGTRELVVEVTRRDGAPIGSRPVTLTIDRTAPVLRLESPAAGAQVSSSSVVRLLVTDASRVQVACYVDERLVWKESLEPAPGGAARLERPLGPLAPGQHTLSIDVVDAALQQTKLSRRIVAVDGAAPPDPTPDPAPGPTPTEPGSTEPTRPAPPPPVLRLSWPEDALLGPGQVALSVEDATSVEVLLDGAPFGGPPIVLDARAVKDGPRVLEVVARNAGGETRELRTFTFDATPPALSVRAPARAPSPVVVEGEVSDAIDPAPRLVASVDGGPPRVVTLPERLELAPGAHTLVYTATDAAGNQAQRTVRVEVTAAPPVKEDPPPPADTQGPVVELLSPPEGGPTRERAVDVRASDPSGLAQVRVQVDGLVRRPDQLTDEPVGGAPGQRLRLALADLKDGRHEVTVEAQDGRGNRTRVTRAWVLDTTPPAVTVEGPRPTTVVGALDLAVRVRDASPVSQVVMAAEGRAPVVMSGTDVYRGRLDLPPGTHEVTVRARDAAGNEGVLALQVDVRAGSATTTPTPTTPAQGDVDIVVPARSGPRVRVTGTLPAGATVTIDVAGVRRRANASLPTDVELPEGRHVVAVTVNLPSGRRGATVTRTVVVDATAPSLDGVRVTALDARRARVTGEARDEGPVSVEVRVGGEVVARALPCEVPLRPGRNEVVVVARDDVGNERGKIQVIDVAEATPTTPATPGTTTPVPDDPLDVTDSGDPREAQALAAFKAGRLDEALALIEQVMQAVREGIRSPYVLRARVRMAQAARANEVERRTLLDQAFHDLTRAMVNYGAAIRSHHHRLRGDVLVALGRLRQAEEDYARADELARREQGR